MTKEIYIKTQLDEILIDLSKDKNISQQKILKVKLIFDEINFIFRGCNCNIRQDRIDKLLKIGFVKKSLYCKNKTLKENQMRMYKSGTIIFDRGTFLLKICTCSYMYNVNYLELQL